MKIAGVEKNSFVDYPEKIAAVVFTPGCNFDCYYCHNRHLLVPQALEKLIPPEEVFTFLKKRKGLLDAVVITGGEPTLQDGLEGFIAAVKELGYAVKLDTNGTNPKILERLLNKGLLDYVAMDIKAPLCKYEEICQGGFALREIKISLDLLLGQNQVPYEFRTTCVPELTAGDILAIAGMIKGARLYALQQYRLPERTILLDEPRLLQEPHSPSYLENIAALLGALVQRCETRGVR
ncbi:MAG: anaerobic ribonucleoside-triphosphate reductase activating protein [Clostridia bacterium]|jgi:pyruvate formate lyase activating enzyme|nr:anaerobic ribonucleoside-triphosphate reductase activating protein [Clostridia bacterium]